MAAHADLIAHVEQLRQRVVALAERVLADVDLQPRRPSENTMKLALPKLRMLTTRPAVIVSTRGASSCTALLS